MRGLTVIYDAECGLCRRVRDWLIAQPKWIALNLVPSTSASRLYPGLAGRNFCNELLVVNNQGGVYVGDHAWIMCLFALKRYRAWALRLSRPGLLPLARQAFALLSNNRRSISRWMGLLSDAELQKELNTINAPRCYGTDL
jgi:predicted DCC family thiol-disulfide oxidoreductase YuxK